MSQPNGRGGTTPADPRRSVERGIATSAAALVVALALTGCSPGSTTDERTADRPRETTVTPGTAKNGTGEVRTDLEPVTDRFSALGTPEAATWSSGTVGGNDVPGPSTYWIDAVVELDPAAAQTLADQTAPEETTEAPDVVDDLAEALPDGPLLMGPALDARFAESGFTARAFLDLDDATVVLVALGE